jgi:hypothetical protein
MFLHQLSDGLHIVAPNRVDQSAGKHQPRPTRRLIAACKHKLRIGELGFAWFNLLGVMLVQFGKRGWIAGSNLTEQILCLMFELIEIRADW